MNMSKVKRAVRFSVGELMGLGSVGFCYLNVVVSGPALVRLSEAERYAKFMAAQFGLEVGPLAHTTHVEDGWLCAFTLRGNPVKLEQYKAHLEAAQNII